MLTFAPTFEEIQLTSESNMKARFYPAQMEVVLTRQNCNVAAFDPMVATVDVSIDQYSAVLHPEGKKADHPGISLPDVSYNDAIQFLTVVRERVAIAQEQNGLKVFRSATHFGEEAKIIMNPEMNAPSASFQFVGRNSAPMSVILNDVTKANLVERSAKGKTCMTLYPSDDTTHGIDLPASSARHAQYVLQQAKTYARATSNAPVAA